MTEQREDKEFAAFLAGESELADRYTKLGHEDPPAELDAHILAEARYAAKIHRQQFGPRGGWLKPVALAATVLLSFSLVMNIVLERPVHFEQVITESTEADSRPDAQLAAGKAELSEQQQPRSDLSTVTITESRDRAVKEITVTARQLPARKLSAEGYVEDRASSSPVRSAVHSAALKGALSIVAEYVAGHAPADALENQALSKAENIRPALPSSATAGQNKVSGNEQKIYDDPEPWLRDIERLNASGSIDEAAALLDKFLSRYPDHPVSVKIHQQRY